jgi:hypothetical protein
MLSISINPIALSIVMLNLIVQSLVNEQSEDLAHKGWRTQVQHFEIALQNGTKYQEQTL